MARQYPPLLFMDPEDLLKRMIALKVILYEA